MNSGVGTPKATPVPNGDMTAPIVSKQAQSRSLTRLGPIRPMNAEANARFASLAPKSVHSVADRRNLRD